MVRFHAELTADRVSKQSGASGYVFESVGLKKEFDDGQVRALRGVDLQIAEGEFVAIIGPSGSGKTTLLQMLGALDRPSAGTLKYRSESLLNLADPAAYRAHEIGFIFQAFHLLPTFTATENVQIPMFENHQSHTARQTRAFELLKAVGLEQRVNHFPAKLSGGERQRVAIARSLANSPSVLLADEPTGNLDSETAKHVLDLLTSLQRELRMTLILVTHDLSVAKRASRAIQMKDGQVVFDGDPANLSNTLAT
jgi:putative ABC transport system ATP-binding protein